MGAMETLELMPMHLSFYENSSIFTNYICKQLSDALDFFNIFFC